VSEFAGSASLEVFNSEAVAAELEIGDLSELESSCGLSLGMSLGVYAKVPVASAYERTRHITDQ